MNIKINKEEYNYLLKLGTCKTYLIGSKLYRTYDSLSDTNYLIIRNKNYQSDRCYPNYHQFQYDDPHTNTQYILTTERAFFKNLFSGDSTINADIILYYDDILPGKLNALRTYNIIKAFTGFAKRDIKYLTDHPIDKIEKESDYKKYHRKMFHATRSLYCAEQLLKSELPNINTIPLLNQPPLLETTETLYNIERQLRQQCNHQFEQNLLTLYPQKPLFPVYSSIELKLIQANNIKEFKY